MAEERELAGRLAELVSEGAKPSEIVNSVLQTATDMKVSDVHFEPVESGLEIRFRLDGVLQSVGSVPPRLSVRVVSRLKVLAELATHRTDSPQDGRIAGYRFSAPGDLRLSTYPTVRGEKAVVRLLTARPEDFALDSLGLSEDVRGALERALSSREGLVAVTGPAGSGKTTTLYAAIQHIRDEAHASRHIVTIEDPVECLLPGVTQTETKPSAGLTAANCLRSILRQDPEVIMVGEVRDRETAALVLEAGLTGHLVLTTMHAGTTAGVFARLLEMRMEPHLITSVVRAVVAQRLVRRLCPDCKREGSDGWETPGCEACLATGFRGRLPLAEILTLTPALRKVVLDEADLEGMEEAARASGMVPLPSRGEELVRNGETTQAEVARVLAGVRPQ